MTAKLVAVVQHASKTQRAVLIPSRKSDLRGRIGGTVAPAYFKDALEARGGRPAFLRRRLETQVPRSSGERHAVGQVEVSGAEARRPSPPFKGRARVG